MIPEEPLYEGSWNLINAKIQEIILYAYDVETVEEFVKKVKAVDMNPYNDGDETASYLVGVNIANAIKFAGYLLFHAAVKMDKDFNDQVRESN